MVSESERLDDDQGRATHNWAAQFTAGLSFASRESCADLFFEMLKLMRGPSGGVLGVCFWIFVCKFIVFVKSIAERCPSL